MQIVLATRSDPPLDLVNLRAKSTIIEIRALDLRFNQAEAADYLRLLLRRPVDEETIVFLSNKSEGWVTGIRLLALSLSRVENMDWTQIDHLENNHMVKDYLMSIIRFAPGSGVSRIFVKDGHIRPLLCPAVRGHL